MEDGDAARSSERLSLSTLLSWALVAFTIEFDNEFERRTPHRTTNFGSTSGAEAKPWLVSLVMWTNCMRYVGAAGVAVGEMERLARTKTNLAGMGRSGYIVARQILLTAGLNRLPSAGSRARPLQDSGRRRSGDHSWRDRGALAHAFWRGRGQPASGRAPGGSKPTRRGAS